MVQTLQDGILKLNHLLFGELFKSKKIGTGWGGRRSHATLRCCWKGNVLLLTCAKFQERGDID
jgi:hypothetical protein